MGAVDDALEQPGVVAQVDERQVLAVLAALAFVWAVRSLRAYQRSV